MGVKSAGSDNPERTNLLATIKKSFNNKSANWFLIILLFVALIFTIVFRYWLSALIISGISLVLIIYTFLSTRKLFAKASSEINDLQQLIENKESYISDFSHRIRTPLNNLPLINDLLGDLDVKGKQKELLETLISSTNNMISALNDLTMKSAGEISIEPRKNIRFDLRKTIENTVELLDIEAAGDIILDITWDDRIESEYIGDPIAIKQIIIDIFSLWSSVPENARHDINIQIKLKSSLEKNDIIDFALETEASPLNIYEQITEETINKRLSSRIIKLIGGTYTYNTEESRAVYSFALPLTKYLERQTVTPVGEKIRKLDTVIRQKKRLSDANVLMVEDNITNQKIVTISLGSKVKNIDTAISGKEALDKFGKSNYDIILMDIQLPVIDGITVSKKIREIEASTSKHTPIIAITANAMIGDKEKCLSAGIDDYLSKPFQPQKLLEMISKYIEGSDNA